MSGAGAQEPVKPKLATYRLTRYSLFWLLVIPTAVGYELWALLNRKDGGPMSHVVWWLYGDPHSLRWHLVGGALTGFWLWLPWHFLYRWPDQWHLLALCALGLLLGAAGYVITH